MVDYGEESGFDLVIGVGNPLMGDDGLGIEAVARLRERWTECDSDSGPLRIVDGGTWGMNLLPMIESARRLLIIDAINRGVTPGERIALTRDELPRYIGLTMSPHQLDLREVLAVAELRGTLPEEALALGIQPERVELSLELSPVVAAEMDALIADVEMQLAEWGHMGSVLLRSCPTLSDVVPNEQLSGQRR